MFSHKVHCVKGNARGSYLVYPMKGETWAIFRHWDTGWASKPEKNVEYQFEFVKVLSDFDEKDGVKVTYLSKVKESLTTLFSNPFHLQLQFNPLHQKAILLQPLGLH